MSRSDKLDPRLFAGRRKFYVFRKKTVAWMNSVNALRLRQINDLVDAQVCGYRRFTFADLIRLVRFGSEQRILIFL